MGSAGLWRISRVIKATARSGFPSRTQISARVGNTFSRISRLATGSLVSTQLSFSARAVCTVSPAIVTAARPSQRLVQYGDLSLMVLSPFFLLLAEVLMAGFASVGDPFEFGLPVVTYGAVKR